MEERDGVGGSGTIPGEEGLKERTSRAVERNCAAHGFSRADLRLS